MGGAPSLLTNAVELLTQLEREESAMLTWGIVDGGFTLPELTDRAIKFAATDPSCQELGHLGEELLEPLYERHLLLPISNVGETIYRTRMAETVRLLARLRQLFPNDLTRGTWSSAPALVGDFRFAVRPRRYPLRNVPPDAMVQEVSAAVPLSDLERSVLRALAAADGRASGLSNFQAEGTSRILGATRRQRAIGVVVSAGTGTGKTLAFYLPAFALIASHVDANFWSKVVAMYPRVELLKDQCSQAAVEARRASAVLKKVGKRGVLVGALYGDTPRTTDDVRRDWSSRQGGYVCPYFRCPECDSPMIWRETDLKVSRERLYCVSASCSGELSEKEVVLTRKRMRDQRPDLLLTTTEMINRCLGTSGDRPLIGLTGPATMRPRLVLLDEVHTYSGTTGAQNALVLRRWRHAMGRQPVFVGLSATLRDARRFFSEVTGLGEHEVVVVEPAQTDLIDEGMEYSIALRGDPTSGAALLATTIQSAMLLRRMLDPRGKASTPRISGERLFAFTDDLDVTNRLYWSLQDAEGWDEFGRPEPPTPERPARSLAALRSPQNPDHAQRFDSGQSWDACVDIGHSLSDEAQLRIDRTSSQDVSYAADSDVVVTTSSLDVGLDDSTVGAILQHKAPREAAQFVQRRGRAGRQRGTRPWTAVVLSDLGRDRMAYEEYDKLFDPELQTQSLPIRNRYVLRMQAAFATMDWLSTRLQEVWYVRQALAGPSADSDKWAEINAKRQKSIAAFIRQTLGDAALQEELAAHIRAALRISDAEVDALLWYPPRAILTAVLPTTLRRLETGWRRVDSRGPKETYGREPLPEFVPANLFSDLLLPEVGIMVPAARMGEEATRQPLSIIQAIQEFAPGRASRRYAIEHGHQRHWSPIPVDSSDARVDIDEYCDGDRIGVLGLPDGGEDREFVCVRPWTISTEKLVPLLRETSNARPVWRTRIESTRAGDTGNSLDLPEGSSWSKVLSGIVAFTHELGSGLTVHRYSIGSDASLLRKSGAGQRVRVRFYAGDAEAEAQPAAVGLSMEVDGMAIRFPLPKALPASTVEDGPRSRAFRTSFVSHLVQVDDVLTGAANDFQVARLYEVMLGVLIRNALETGGSLAQAYESLPLSELRQRVIDQITGKALAGPADQGPEAEDVESDDVEDLPHRAAALVDLCQRDDVMPRMRDLLTALWFPPDPRWDEWYRARYAATVGAAVVEACYRLCPESGRQELMVDLSQENEGEGQLWITETVPGGTGVVQSVIETYAQDPRRFLRLVEAALGPAEQEFVGDSLKAILDLLGDDASEARAAVDDVRQAWTAGREPLVTAFSSLIKALRTRGISTTHSVISALNTRILRPGSGHDTDDLLRLLLTKWAQIEAQLGIEVDLRQYASWVADQPEVSAILSSLPGATGQGRLWHVSVVTGLLWPRGNSLRARALNASHRFSTHPPADWEIVREVLQESRVTVDLVDKDWSVALTQALLSSGSAVLSAPALNAAALKQAVLACVCSPIDAGYLLLYPRVVGWHRTRTLIEVTIELREAPQ